jgi:hypothetical protein
MGYAATLDAGRYRYRAGPKLATLLVGAQAGIDDAGRDGGPEFDTPG